LGIEPNPQSPIPNPQSPIPKHILNSNKKMFLNLNQFYIILNK